MGNARVRIVAVAGLGLLLHVGCVQQPPEHPDPQMQTKERNNTGRGTGPSAPPLEQDTLARAIERGDLHRLQELLDAGADPNEAAEGPNPWPALLIAIKYGRVDAVRVLIESGADVDGPEGSDFVPLLAAIKRNEPECAELLLEAGASVDMGDATANILHDAVRLGVGSLVASLLDAGADPNLPDRSGASPLVLATRSSAGEPASVVRALLAGGADPEWRNDRGETVLINAVDRSARLDPEAVRALREAGVDLDATSTSGDSALWRAVMRRKPDAVATLVAAGADPDVRNLNGETPLMLAAQTGQVQMIQTLIGAGANAYAQNREGKTAMAIAQATGQGQSVAAIQQLTGINATQAPSWDSTQDEHEPGFSREEAGEIHNLQQRYQILRAREEQLEAELEEEQKRAENEVEGPGPREFRNHTTGPPPVGSGPISGKQRVREITPELASVRRQLEDIERKARKLGIGTAGLMK